MGFRKLFSHRATTAKNESRVNSNSLALSASTTGDPLGDVVAVASQAQDSGVERVAVRTTPAAQSSDR